MGNNSKKCLKPKKKQKLPGSRSDSAVEDINMTNCCVTRPLITEERHYSAWTRAKIAASLCWGTVSGQLCHVGADTLRSGSGECFRGISSTIYLLHIFWGLLQKLTFVEYGTRDIAGKTHLWSPIIANVWQCLGSQAQKWEITEYLLLSSSDGCAGLGEDVTWPGDKSRYITHKLIRIQPWRAVDPEHAAVAMISFICHTERH